MGVSGKSRSNKRSSSHASTITTVIFIALCVLGVWMLTSNSVTPPQTTTAHTTTAIDTTTNNAFLSSNEQPKGEEKPVFEDNPGNLPDDAIKPDDNKSHGDHRKDTAIGTVSESEGVVKEEHAQGFQGGESTKEQENQKDDHQLSEESILTQNQQSEQTSQEQSQSEEILQLKSEETNRNKDEQSTEQQQDENHTESLNQISEENQQLGKQQELENDEGTKDSKNKKLKDDKKQHRRQKQHQITEEGEQKRIEQQTLERQPTQEISATTFPDETRDAQTELAGVKQSGSQRTSVLPAHDHDFLQQQTSDKETKNQGQNPETQQRNPLKEEKSTESNTGKSLASGIPKESTESKKSWATQATQSKNEKERQKDDESGGGQSMFGYTWQLCNVTAGPDYIPCLDNEMALRHLHNTKHFEHRERHCPEEGPTCLVPVPQLYKRSIKWPESRDKIWYHNVPHTKLAAVKGHQNWVKVSGELITFPGGGTQFIHGALHYIDFLQESVPGIGWGKHTRVILDVGCGVASFGGYLFERDVLTMSFAPKDEHEAQVQFALERGIPALSAVMGSQRLPFPSRVFDLVHCARCRVPWHNEGGLLLLELNRVLRPGGYFVWSATPVYQKLKQDIEIWEAMTSLTASMCWELVTIRKDELNSVGAAIYRKPTSNECYGKRQEKIPPMCKSDDDPNAAWYVPLQACMHRVPVDKAERGTSWPMNWPQRLKKPPYWLNSSQMGIYGKPAPQDFATDYEHWKGVVSNLYMSGLGIDWSEVRNIMDMRAVYGGFAAALRELKAWVLNVVNIDSPDTLPIIYERGLFGIYHDWCESFSTYPRSYDLLHADHLFSKLKKRCKFVPVMAEVDRMLRPGGKLIVRDESTTIGEVEILLKSLHWEVHFTFSKDKEGILSAQKGDWRPDTYQASS
ncbi:hypothetical protein SLE2022_010550 [Rubroshorea leprosula]